MLFIRNQNKCGFFFSKGQYRKSGYFGVGIIWLFCVKMGVVKFWRFVSRVCFILAVKE